MVSDSNKLLTLIKSTAGLKILFRNDLYIL